MRRTAPILIVVIGLAALVLDFWPGLKLPIFGDPNGASRTVETKLGLDLQGGLQVTYQAQPAGGKIPGSGDLSTIQSIIENRVNSTGVAEPIVQTLGTDRIVVELPGVNDPEAIRSLVGRTGLLEFVPLPTDKYGTQTNPGPNQASQGQPLPVPEPALFGGDQLDTSGISPGFDSQTNQRTVNFKLKDKGSQLFSQYTSSHVNQFFAIVLDGKVVSAPYIREPITTGQGQISGSFTIQEMNDLVTVLKYGALPFPIKEISSTDISATLGLDFLRQSLIAGLIGIGLVFLFMLIYYRLPGLIADGALIYYTLVVLAIFRLIPVTLTLAGVAGFVLSVGMAVDANILIFERSKEELRVGKTLPAAIEAGFNRAWNSILDSNVSSLITAGILYWFGSSTIRGFALVLIIGVLTSMFTAVTVSRTLLRFVVQQEGARKAWLFGVTDAEFLARPATRIGREVRSRV